MKLLEKQTIVTLKGNERKKEIEEGAKLAKKVDLLRETASKEEARLAKFRTESLAKLKEDIDKLVVERDGLRGQIKTLEENRIQLLVPLDKKWNEINEKDKKLQELGEMLKQRELTLKKCENDLESNRKKLEIEKSRIDDIKKQASDELSMIDNYNKEAEQLLKDTQRTCNITLTQLEQRRTAVEQKENDVAYKYVDLQNREAQIERDREWLRKEKIRVRDREQTLERNITRFNKNKNG